MTGSTHVLVESDGHALAVSAATVSGFRRGRDAPLVFAGEGDADWVVEFGAERSWRVARRPRLVELTAPRALPPVAREWGDRVGVTAVAAHQERLVFLVEPAFVDGGPI